jgi:hypothetical protein
MTLSSERVESLETERPKGSPQLRSHDERSQGRFKGYGQFATLITKGAKGGSRDTMALEQFENAVRLIPEGKNMR